MTEAETKEKSESLSQKYADFVVNLDYSKIPDEVVEKAKLHLLDSIGIMMAGAGFDSVKPAIDMLYDMGGKQESSVVGRTEKIPAPNAAFCNALILHSLDFDDTHLRSGTHVSVTAVPTGLALGEVLGSTGEELLAAIIAGYEVGTRIGGAYPWEMRHRGFHNTSVIGTFIAATVAGKLMKLDSEQLTSAYGIAGSFSSGIMQSILEGSWVKPFHPAWASHGGIIAARLAQSGYGGPKQVLEGEKGFYNSFMYGEKSDRIYATSDLGEVWETMNISPKPYPSCHSTHSSIDAIRNIRDTIAKDSDNIKEITVYAPQLAFDLGLFAPGKSKPASAYDAKFSVPYTVAATLLKGNPSIWDFTEDSIKNEDFLKISGKVKGILDSGMEQYKSTDARPARVIVEYADKRVEEMVVNHKGTPGNPFTGEDVVDKFRNNLSRSKFRDSTEELISEISGTENTSVAKLASYLSR